MDNEKNKHDRDNKQLSFKDRLNRSLNRGIEHMKNSQKKHKERQRELNEKYKKGKIDRLYKMQIRAKYEYKWLSRFVQLSAIGVVGLFSFGAYKNIDEIQAKYHESSVWEKADTTKISSIPPELLYLDETMREKSLEYIRLQDDIYDVDKGDFKRGVTEDEINTLNDRYNELDEMVQGNMKRVHDEINANYEIRQDYYSIVSKRNKDTISSSASLEDIQGFIIEHVDTLMEQLIEEGNHEFANRMRNNMIKLSSDVSVIEEIYRNLDDVFQYKQGKKGLEVNVSPTAEPTSLPNLVEHKRSLNYNWSSVTNVLPNIYKKSNDVLSGNQKSREQYESYQKDISDKESFESFNQSYKEAVKRLNNNIIELPDFSKMDYDDLKKWAKDNDITLNLKNETTTDESLDNQIVLDSDLSDYKRILKGVTIKGMIYKYEPPVEERSNDDDDNKDDDDKDNNERDDNSESDNERDDNSESDNEDDESDDDSENDVNEEDSQSEQPTRGNRTERSSDNDDERGDD